jgi:hypothetical protein
MRRRRASGAERRRFARVSGDAVVRCTPRATPGVVGGRTLNFSAGGVLFVAPAPLDPGQDVDLVLRLPGEDEVLSLTGRVVRVRSLSDTAHEIAAEFVGGDAATQRSLLAFIEERAPVEAGPPPLSA